MLWFEVDNMNTNYMIPSLSETGKLKVLVVNLLIAHPLADKENYVVSENLNTVLSNYC